MCHLDRVFNDCVHGAIFEFEMKLAASDPGEVEQVVNQSGLQLHVALYNLNILDELRRKLLRVILEVCGRCQSWRQRGTQLMAERGQKVVLRLARFLCRDFLRFKLAAPNLVGNVACDFGETAKFLPMISSAEYPLIFSAPVFHVITSPLGSSR